MPQDNNHIENKLRELEEKQSPDLNQLDEHWQQMQLMLQAPALPVKKLLHVRYAKLLLPVAIIVAGVSIYYVTGKKDQHVAAAKISTAATTDQPKAVAYKKLSAETTAAKKTT